MIVREVAQQRILLQARGQDAFGDDEQPRVGGELALEADVPADLAAERPAALVGDAPRHRSRRHPPRLQQHDAARRRRAPAARAWSCRRPAPPSARPRDGAIERLM